MAEMAGSESQSVLDHAFDMAFSHLSACRIAYEDDPRDPVHIAALGAARGALEDARTAMSDERRRLGFKPRSHRVAKVRKVEGEGPKLWQTARIEG